MCEALEQIQCPIRPRQCTEAAALKKAIFAYQHHEAGRSVRSKRKDLSVEALEKLADGYECRSIQRHQTGNVLPVILKAKVEHGIVHVFEGDDGTIADILQDYWELYRKQLDTTEVGQTIIRGLEWMKGWRMCKSGKPYRLPLCNRTMYDAFVDVIQRTSSATVSLDVVFVDSGTLTRCIGELMDEFKQRTHEIKREIWSNPGTDAESVKAGIRAVRSKKESCRSLFEQVTEYETIFQTQLPGLEAIVNELSVALIAVEAQLIEKTGGDTL